MKRFVLLAAGLMAAQVWADDVLNAAWKFHAPSHAAAMTRTNGTFHIEVLKPVQPFYGTGLSQIIAAPVANEHRLVLSFRARSATANPIRAVLEKSGVPYTSVLEQNLTLGPEWKSYQITGATDRDWPDRGLALHFQMGHQAGEIELQDITLKDAGLDPELQAAKAALTEEQMAARIRQYRMGDLQIVVRDAAGRPVPNVTVQIDQQSHAFLFGCNIFELKPDDNSPLQKAYQERFTALLNYATLPFYWGAFEHEQGHPDYARLEKMAQWCQVHGVICKGHPLVWHEAWPKWAPQTADDATPLLRQRVFDILPRYHGLIRFWDVLNEANNAAGYTQTGEGQWIKREGPASVVATALGWAREAGRGAGYSYLYNDFNTGASNERLLAELQARNALPDAIGIQSHMHDGLWPLTRVWNVAEHFSKFGRPVHFTEVTVISGPPRKNEGHTVVRNWNSTPGDEAQQAQYVAAFYTLLFSHPNVQAITWWDFSDLHAWKGAPAGFLRKDMTPKPVYDVLYKLIRESWWTHATSRTDAAGTATVRVFRGAHKVTITDGTGRTSSQTVELPINENARQVSLILPNRHSGDR